MTSTIKNKEDLNYFLPQLISNYKAMFSESPFNNPNITDEYAKDFFINTFENDLIFISTSTSRTRISGFRTLIPSEYFKDFKKLNLEKNSIYLSCLWISKELRGRGLGNQLMNYSIRTINKEFGSRTLYVRTRNDTPNIIYLLEKKGFQSIEKYPVTINNQDLELILHKL